MKEQAVTVVVNGAADMREDANDDDREIAEWAKGDTTMQNRESALHGEAQTWCVVAEFLKENL